MLSVSLLERLRPRLLVFAACSVAASASSLPLPVGKMSVLISFSRLERLRPRRLVFTTCSVSAFSFASWFHLELAFRGEGGVRSASFRFRD